MTSSSQLMKGQIMFPFLVLLITFGLFSILNDKNGKIWPQGIIVNI